MNEPRNIDVDNEVEPAKKLTPDEAKKKKEEDDLFAYRFKKMNKKAKAKYEAKKKAQKEAEKIKKELEARKMSTQGSMQRRQEKNGC